MVLGVTILERLQAMSCSATGAASGSSNDGVGFRLGRTHQKSSRNLRTPSATCTEFLEVGADVLQALMFYADADSLSEVGREERPRAAAMPSPYKCCQAS